MAPHDEDTLLLAALFVTAGYALSTVFDASTARTMCTLSAPAAVIVDLDTPSLDAIGVVAQLRALPGCGRIRIVAIAAARAPAITAEALRVAGVDRVVERPATVTKLIDAIASPRDQRAT